TVHSSADLSRRLSAAPLNTPGRCLLRMESHQEAKSKAALCHRHEGRQPIRHWRAVGELERPTLHGGADMKSNYKVASGNARRRRPWHFCGPKSSRPSEAADLCCRGDRCLKPRCLPKGIRAARLARDQSSGGRVLAVGQNITPIEGDTDEARVHSTVGKR